MFREGYHFRYNKKILFLMLALFLLNGVCFLQQQFRQNSYHKIKEETSFRLQLLREVQGMDMTGKEEYISDRLNGHNSEEYKNVCLELLAQMEHITTYDAYLMHVIEESERVSRFSVFAADSSDFSKQNAANVLRAYKRLAGSRLLVGNDKPIVQFMEYRLWIYLSVIMTILGAFMLIRERGTGITQIIYSSPRGRLQLGIRRWGFICLSAFICTGLNMLVVWFLSMYLYGGGIEIGRSIQSIGMFSDVTSQVSVSGFLLQYYLTAALAVAVLGVFVWMVMNLIPNTILSLLIVVVGFLFEYQCARSITLQSNWRFLKYINLLEYLHMEDYLFKYYDLNCFGRAVPLLLFVVSGIFVLFLGFSVVGILAFGVRSVGKWRKLKLPEVFCRLQEYYNLCAAELYKILFCRKGIFVILVMFFAVFEMISEKNIAYTDVEQYVNGFYDRYEGPLTEEVYQYIESESEYVKSIYEQYEKTYQSYQNGEADKFALFSAEAELKQAKIVEEGLLKIQAEIERAEGLEQEKGIRICLMNSEGYDMLFGIAGKITQRNIIVLCLLCMVFMFSGNLKYEQNCKISYLLRSTAKGRKELLHAKEIAILLVTLLIACILYGVQFYNMKIQYGLPIVSAPIQSIGSLHSFPFRISILTYMSGVFILRCVLYMLIADLLLYLSVQVEQKMMIIAFSIIVIIPMILGRMSVMVDKFSCYDLLNVNEMILGETSRLFVLLKLAVLLVIVVVVRISAVKKWCGGKTYDS